MPNRNEPTAPLPAFRSDLLTRADETAASLQFIIHNPDTGRTIRLGEFERFIVQQLDGTTSLEQIRQRLQAQFDGEVDPDDLASFILSLNARGLLQLESDEHSQMRCRINGSLLYLRFNAYDPDRHITHLARRLWFCFTPAFVVIAGVVIALAVAVCLSNLVELKRDIAELFTFNTLIAAWFIVIGTTVIHEYAHGLTCKHFGGRVGEMGVMLIFFQPALYCNVSDAWMFSEKYKRIWVTAAGGFVDLLIWALAILAWRVCAPETTINYVATVIAATATLRTVFNLNPLIKLDGYYLLSDWLELPNLRQRAVAYLRSRFHLERAKSRRAKAQTSQRERCIYILYGVLSLAFSIWLLSFIAGRIGSFLIGHLQGTGFVIFTGLVVFALWPLLKRASVWKLAGEFRRDTAGTMKRGLIWLLLLLLAGVGMVVVEMEATVSGEFTIHPEHNAVVRAQVEGVIEHIGVKEGDWVRRGQVIASLAAFDKQAEFGRIQANIRQTSADLKALNRGTTVERLAVARQSVKTARTNLLHTRKRFSQAESINTDRIARATSSVAKAEERLHFALKETSRQEKLVNKQLSSEKFYDDSLAAAAIGKRAVEEARADLRIAHARNLAEERQAIAVAERAVIDAQARLDVLVAGSSQEEIDATTARLERLVVDRDYIQAQIALLAVRSPIDGVVITSRPTERVGQLARKGELILEVCDFRMATAEIYLSEKDIGEVHLGQEVVLKARAFAGKRFMGAVAAIASTAQGHADGLQHNMVRISTRIPNRDLTLKPGMSGHGKVRLGKQHLYEIVSRRLVRFIRVEFWSWW